MLSQNQPSGSGPVESHRSKITSITKLLNEAAASLASLEAKPVPSLFKPAGETEISEIGSLLTRTQLLMSSAGLHMATLGERLSTEVPRSMFHPNHNANPNPDEN